MTPKPPTPPLTDEELSIILGCYGHGRGLSGLERRLVAKILDLQRQLGEAKANQRTPGTVEVCEKCGKQSPTRCTGHDTELGHLSCPIRSELARIRSDVLE